MSSSAEGSPQTSLSSTKQNDSRVVKLLSSLQETGNFEIGIQSILDALDLWISSLKYYFDAMNPASGSMSSKMFFEWLHSEEGLIVFLLGALFSGIFAYLGNGVKKEHQTDFSKFADTCWPYIRDVIKRLKWTFKGTRSLLLVSQTLLHQNLISYITPLGILLGVVGALNQLWNRNMVETRKALQQSNDLFRRQVKGINACFMEIDEKLLTDDPQVREPILKHIYAGSILVAYTNESAQKTELLNLVKQFNPEQQSVLNDFLDQLEQQIKQLPEESNTQTNGSSAYWEQYQQLLENYRQKFEEKQIHKDENPFWNIYLTKRKLIQNTDKHKKYLLIDQDGNEQDLLNRFKTFTLEQQSVLNEFLEQLEQKIKKIPEESKTQAQGSRIYWEQYQQLLENYRQKFEEKQIHKDENPFWQVYQAKQKFIQDKVLNDTSDTRQYLISAAQFQSNSSQAFASSILSGLLNSPYYFLGVLSMVVIPPPFFIYAVGACSLFMILNVISEYDQEADYQRRLKISELKAKLIMNKRLLLLEWQNFDHNFQGPTTLWDEITSLSNDLKKAGFNNLHLLIDSKFPSTADKPKNDLSPEAIKAMDLSQMNLQQLVNLDDKKQMLLDACIRIENLEREYLKNHLNLGMQLQLSSGIVWRQSLRNGLVVYGAFNSLLMTVATMSFLFGLTITPIFFYVSILVGFTILISTMTYTWLFIRPKEDKNLDDQDDNAEEFGVTKEQNPERICEDTKKDNTLYVGPLTYDIMNIPEIKRTSNLLIPEHAEVFRQMLSGVKKGIKSIQVVLPLFVSFSEDDNPILLMTYLGVSLSYAYFFALKGLRGLMRVDNEAYKESFMYCRLTGEKRPSVMEDSVLASQMKAGGPFFRTGSTAELTTIQPPRSPRPAADHTRH
jgi:hypothetical protein